MKSFVLPAVVRGRLLGVIPNHLSGEEIGAQNSIGFFCPLCIIHNSIGWPFMKTQKEEKLGQNDRFLEVQLQNFC